MQMKQAGAERLSRAAPRCSPCTPGTAPGSCWRERHQRRGQPQLTRSGRRLSAGAAPGPGSPSTSPTRQDPAVGTITLYIDANGDGDADRRRRAEPDLRDLDPEGRAGRQTTSDGLVRRRLRFPAHLRVGLYHEPEAPCPAPPAAARSRSTTSRSSTQRGRLSPIPEEGPTRGGERIPEGAWPRTGEPPPTEGGRRHLGPVIGPSAARPSATASRSATAPATSASGFPALDARRPRSDRARRLQ